MKRNADRVISHAVEHMEGCDRPECKLALAMIAKLREDDEAIVNGGNNVSDSSS